MGESGKEGRFKANHEGTKTRRFHGKPHPIYDSTQAVLERKMNMAHLKEDVKRIVSLIRILTI